MQYIKRDGCLKIRLSALILVSLIQVAANAEAASAVSYASVERLFLRGDYATAAKKAKEFIESSSASRREKEEAGHIRGLSLLKAGQYKDARDAFRQFLSKYPKSRRTFDIETGIGDTYLLEGDIDKAVKIYQDILARYSNDKNIVIVHSRLGDCYKRASSDDRVAVIKEDAYFSVQVGSFKKRRNAEKYAAKLSQEGFESFVEVPTGSGDGLYRVRVGKFRSRIEAQGLESKLKKRGYSTKIWP